MTDEKKKKDYKSIIMAALASVPENMLPNKAFLWAASNLPDSDNEGSFSKGKFVINYDHSSDDVLKALGISKPHAYFLSKYGEFHYKMMSKISEIGGKEEAEKIDIALVKISGEFQRFVENVGNEGFLWLAAKGFMELREEFSTQKEDTIKELLKASHLSLSKSDIKDPEKLAKMLESLRTQLEKAMSDPDSIGAIVVNGLEIQKEEDLPESMPESIKKLIMAIVIAVRDKKK